MSEHEHNEGYKIYAMNLSSHETPYDRVTEIEVFHGDGKSTIYRAIAVAIDFPTPL